MARAVYICGDVVGAPGGAGAVTRHELNALKAVYEDVTVLDGQVLVPSYYQHLGIPFLQDYFTVAHLKKLGPFSHGHFYSNGFTQAVWWLKEHGATVSYSTPAHDPTASIEEFRIQALPDRPPFPFPHISDPELYKLHGQGLVDADVVIAASSASRVEVMKLRGEIRDNKNVIVIPHGTDWPETVPPFPEKFSVGYLGQVGPDKGLVYLLRAFELLRESVDIRLVIGGGVAVEEMVRREIGGGDVVVTGYVEKISDFFKEVSVYCQPAVTEGFGIPVLEAMAHGRPVVCSDGAGASDLVDEADGFKIRPRDVHGLASGIALLESASMGTLMNYGRRHREIAQSYTWDKIEARYRDVFRKFRNG